MACWQGKLFGGLGNDNLSGNLWCSSKILGVIQPLTQPTCICLEWTPDGYFRITLQLLQNHRYSRQCPARKWSVDLLKNWGSLDIQCFGNRRSRFDASTIFKTPRRWQLVSWWCRNARKETCTWKNVWEKAKFPQSGKWYAQFLRHCASPDCSSLDTASLLDELKIF